MFPWAISLLDHARCIIDDNVDSIHLLASHQFYLDLIYQCNLLSDGGVHVLKVCNHGWSTRNVDHILQSLAFETNKNHYFCKPIQFFECCNSTACLNKLLDFLKALTIKAHVVIKLPNTLTTLRLTLELILPLWNWKILTDMLLTPFNDLEVEWIHQDHCLSHKEIASCTEIWCAEQTSHITAEEPDTEIENIEMTCSQCLIVTDDDTTCREIEETITGVFLHQKEVCALKRIDSPLESKLVTENEKKPLILVIPKDVFVNIKGHFVDFVVVSCDLSDFVQYVNVKAKLMRIKPNKVVYFHNDNEEYHSYLYHTVSKEYLAPIFTDSYRSLYRLCGMYSASMYGKVEIETVRITGPSEHQTLIYLPMKSTVNRIAEGQSLQIGCLNPNKSDESALHHAVEILQENNDLDESGEIVRRKYDEIMINEFFELPATEEEMSTIDASLHEDQNVYVYPIVIKETYNKDGSPLNTDMEEEYQIGIISSTLLPKVKNMVFSDYYGSQEVVIKDGFTLLLNKEDSDVLLIFQKVIFQKVYNFDGFSDEISSKYCVGLIRKEDGTLNLKAMTKIHDHFINLVELEIDSSCTLSTLDANTSTLILPKHALPKSSPPFRVVEPDCSKLITELFTDITKGPTYKDYFYKKYNIDLPDSETMIPVKHLKMILNCSNEVDFSVRKKSRSKPIELPRSLCCAYPLSYEMWRKFCMVPSILYNLKQYTTAQFILKQVFHFSEMKDDIGLKALKNLRLANDPSKLLETLRTALVTTSALEDRNNELLEFYGDSILKYAVNICLFLQKPNFNEHSLNLLKSQLVNNELLYKIGLSRQLYLHLFYEKFEPKDFELYLVESHQSKSEKYREHNNKLISDGAEGLIGVFFTLDHSNHVWLDLLEWYGYKFETLRLFLKMKQYPKWCFQGSEKLSGNHDVPVYLTKTMTTLEKTLNYEFKDQLLVVEALSHCTLPRRINQFTPCNQRLEFIGDAVLEVMITTEILKRNERRSTKYDQGQLSEIRSSLVCTYILAVLATRLCLHKHLRVLDFGMAEYIMKFVEKLEERKNNFSKDFIDANILVLGSSDDDLEVPKDLADCLEAVIGAVYMDFGGDLQATWNVFKEWFSDIIDFYFEKIPPSIFVYLQKLCPDGEFHQLPRSMNGYHNWKWTFCDMEVLSTGRTSKVTKSKVAAEAVRRLREQPLLHKACVL